MNAEHIYHITSREAWQAAQYIGAYYGDTLESEGFIHTSTKVQVPRTANRFYRGRAGLILLTIEPSRLSSELRYEAAGDGDLFPHIYGPLNLDAVSAVTDFPANPDGTFNLNLP